MSQRLSTPRAKLGLVTLICLLWHILLPTWVNLGLMPALYALPAHCQPVVQTLLQLSPATAMTPQSPIMADMHDMHAHHMMGHTQHAIDNSPADPRGHHDAHDAGVDQSQTNHTQITHTQITQAQIDQHIDAKTQAMWQLAAKIMKSCPLCSHGLDGALLPVLAFVFVLLLLLGACRQPRALTPYRTLFFATWPYLRPQPHGPPLISILF